METHKPTTFREEVCSSVSEISHLKGSIKKKTTAEDYEKIRAKAFEEIYKKLI